MYVHSYGTTTDGQPDTSTIVEMGEMGDPAEKGELLRKYRFDALAVRAEHVPLPDCGYQPLDDVTYRKYFCDTPDPKTFDRPIDALLPDLAKADKALNGMGGKLFDKLELWATPDKNALLLVGVAGKGSSSLYFLVSQGNYIYDDREITVDEMRAKLDEEDRAKAKEIRNQRIIGGLGEAIGPAAGVLAITSLSLLVFWQNWNWWLFGVVILAVGALVSCLDDEGEHPRPGAAPLISAWLGWLCIAMVAFYGIVNFCGAVSHHTITQKTILVCSKSGPVGKDYYSSLKTQDGTPYDISDKGHYEVTQNGQIGNTKSVYESTSAAAAATFQVGHTYLVTVDSSPFDGDQITAGKEVANTLGQCG